MKFLYTGKTAVITGAAGALGSAYAFELARRGCNVVINDIGSSLSGQLNNNEDPAGKVVSEIRRQGGKAIANYENVLNGTKIVETTLKEFGTCDILINNAGILRDKSFAKLTKEDWKAVLDVHLEGTFSLCHAVWPIMQQQNYGRIINIGSGAGLYGNFGQSNYSAAKMAIFGLTNTLALEGDKYNIKVNCVVPVAGSRMTETVLPKDMLKLLDPHQIVPIVAYLAHDTNEYSGSCFECGGGWYSQVRFQRSIGLSFIKPSTTTNTPPVVATIEDIASNIGAITDFTECTYPTSPADALRDMIRTQELNSNHITTKNMINSDTNDSTKLNDPIQTKQATIVFPSDKIFSVIQNILNHDQSRTELLASKLKATVVFNINHNNNIKKWILNLKPNEQSFLINDTLNNDNNKKSNVILSCSDDTLIKLTNGSLTPEYAYMRGWLKIEGQMGVALKVKLLLLDLKISI